MGECGRGVGGGVCGRYKRNVCEGGVTCVHVRGCVWGGGAEYFQHGNSKRACVMVLAF